LGTDAREARRSAEKAARDLINDRAALIGDLGTSAHHRATTKDGVATARAEGALLIAAARAQAATLVTTATDAVASADQAYAAAYTAALTGGWQRSELKTMKYPPPGNSRPPTASAETASAQPSSNDDDHH
jgi:hypothetical protein